MAKSECYRAVESVVRCMGLSCSNISMRQFIYGVELLHYEPDLIDAVTKRLYPRIAERFPNANGKSVERNLRTARAVILERADPERRAEVLGYRQIYSFSVADLMDTVVFYMDRRMLWPVE